MDEDYRIDHVEKVDDSLWKAIGGGLQKYNVQQTGNEKFNHVCFVIYGPDQEISGGLIGEVYWGWCFVHLLWIKDDLRGRGYGHRLLTMAEEEARKQGAKNIYLDTFSFQAPDFYKQHGYQVFGELKDFPPGHQRYFLTKQL